MIKYTLLYELYFIRVVIYYLYYNSKYYFHTRKAFLR